MKRLLTLIFALLTLTMATQNVYAKATKNLIVYLTDGMCLDDSNEDAYMAVSALIAFGQIKKEYNNILHSDVYSSNSTTLFIEYGIGITFSNEVTYEDDIYYTITDEDRAKLTGAVKQYMEPYKLIELHFLTNLQDMTGTVKTGLVIKQDKDAQMVVELFTIFFRQLYKEKDAMTGDDIYLSKQDKKLFSINNDGVVSISLGVSSADDIIYTITNDDRRYVRSLGMDTEATQMIIHCKTIKLHFDTSGGTEFLGPHGDLGTQGTWRLEDGVLTIDYVGQMPWNCTSKTTDPEVAYRLKWIDYLADIKEIVITGVDVEVQPYFLFYSGDGPNGSHPDDHVRTLTLGSGVKKVGKQALTLYDLKRVNVYRIDPPVLASDLGESNCFWKSRIEANQAFLYLPANAGIGYAMIKSEWAYFNHSTNHLDMADAPVGIKLIDEGQQTAENRDAWYTLDGRKLSGKPTQKGIYVNSGKKVFVK